jgi:hypothetical protein
LLDDVLAQHPENREMGAKFEQSKTYGGLVLELLKPEVAENIATAIRKVAEGILSGTISSALVDQTYGDAVTVEQYRSALKQLLDAFPSNYRTS